MSLFRTCKQAPVILHRASPRALTEFCRYSSSESAVGTKPPSDIVVPEQPPREVMVADVISGAPGELRHRAVRVYQACRNTMQSGSGKSNRWRIDFDNLPGGGRWENPLMGYASSADYMQGTRLSFRSKEDAIHFAEKQGWDYYVQTPTVERIPPKNYAENYVYRPSTLRIMRTK